MKAPHADSKRRISIALVSIARTLEPLNVQRSVIEVLPRVIRLQADGAALPRLKSCRPVETIEHTGTEAPASEPDAGRRCRSVTVGELRQVLIDGRKDARRRPVFNPKLTRAGLR